VRAGGSGASLQRLPPLRARREREAIGVDGSAEHARQLGAIGVRKVRVCHVPDMGRRRLFSASKGFTYRITGHSTRWSPPVLVALHPRDENRRYIVGRGIAFYA
jgi:hypothetical protein